LAPLGGIGGVFLIALEFQTARFVAAACPSIVETALPHMASKFARHMHIAYNKLGEFGTVISSTNSSKLTSNNLKLMILSFIAVT
jgi:hypothetical protein